MTKERLRVSAIYACLRIPPAPLIFIPSPTFAAVFQLRLP
jgi:hypothetical protein